MKPPPSLHSNFFSSLKQVEKRLKLEHPSQAKTSTNVALKHQEIVNNNLSVEESLSSPIHIHLDQLNDNQISPTLPESSELPQAFLSCSPQFPSTHEDENPLQPNSVDNKKIETEAVDDIEELIQLLGLSDYQQKPEKEEEDDEKRVGFGFERGSCRCEGGFYSKIAGVKGPKCGKEVERLEGWINYFLNGGGGGGEEKVVIEPLRLSLLLLGKAAFVSGGGNCGFGGLDFPSSIDDFLMNDPPPN